MREVDIFPPEHPSAASSDAPVMQARDQGAMIGEQHTDLLIEMHRHALTFWRPEMLPSEAARVLTYDQYIFESRTIRPDSAEERALGENRIR
jgi:hypothetical protein